MVNPLEILHAAGLRRTPVRTGVIETLIQSAGRPMSVLDVASKLPRGTDMVTIYRTLNTLHGKGLVSRVRGDDRNWLYEFNSTNGEDEHVHAHFVCDSCGAVECLDDLATPPLNRAALKLGDDYEVHKQEVTLHGKCPKCH